MMEKIVLCVLLALVVGHEASILGNMQLQRGLTVRFGIGSDYFISMPTNVTEAAKNFTQKELPSSLSESDTYSDLVMYCTTCAPTICLFYDPCTGNVAGMQIAILKSNFTTPFNLTESGFVEWDGNDSGELEYWAIKVMFMSEEYLSKTCVERMESYDYATLVQGSAVYPDGNTGPVPTNGTILREEDKFKQQSCIWLMGTHYFYDMTSDLPECTSKTMPPWFTLLHGDDGTNQTLCGIGLLTVGTYDLVSCQQYHETPNSIAVKVIAPNAPDCLSALADDPGFVTVHIYFVDNPKLIFC